MHRRRRRHLFLEAIDDLDLLVEAVRLVELLGRCGVLQAPGAIGPDVDFADRSDDPGIQVLLQRPPHARGVPLVAHLRRELGIFRRGLADQARLPDVVGQRLLAVDVLAVGQRQVRRKRVGMLGGGDDDRVELVGLVEHSAQIVEPAGFRKALRRRFDGVVVDVTEHGDVFVRMRGYRRVRIGAASGGRHLAWRDRQLVQAGQRTPAAGDEGNPQAVIEVLAAKEGRRARDRSRRGDRPAHEIASRQLPPVRALDDLFHVSAPWRPIVVYSAGRSNRGSSKP